MQRNKEITQDAKLQVKKYASISELRAEQAAHQQSTQAAQAAIGELSDAEMYIILSALSSYKSLSNANTVEIYNKILKLKNQ